MGKQPAFQFYPGDWTRDLDDYDLEIEGAWIRLCCRLWWSQERGKMTKTLKEFSIILRKSEKKTKYILNFLLTKGLCDGSILDNQNITIISRRMVKDNELSIIRQRVGRLGGNPGLKKIKENLDNQSINQNATKSASLLLQSSSSSSISSSKKIKNKDKILFGDSVLLTEIEYQKLCEKFTKIKADDMIEGMNLYAASQPKNFKKYASHYATLLNWERKNEKDNKITINSDEEICKACQFNNYPYCRKHSDKRNCKKIGGSVR